MAYSIFFSFLSPPSLVALRMLRSKFLIDNFRVMAKYGISTTTNRMQICICSSCISTDIGIRELTAGNVNRNSVKREQITVSWKFVLFTCPNNRLSSCSFTPFYSRGVRKVVNSGAKLVIATFLVWSVELNSLFISPFPLHDKSVSLGFTKGASARNNATVPGHTATTCVNRNAITAVNGTIPRCLTQTQ